MGGRGSGSGSGVGGGGLNPADIVSTRSLISEREGKRKEVDQALKTLRAVGEKYNVTIEDAQVAVLKGRGASTMGYFDADGNIAINESYFDAKKMNSAYDESVKAKFHPPRGKKSGIEAVMAHELGHRLTEAIGKSMGLGDWALDLASDRIVRDAAKAAGYGNRTRQFRGAISGYAKKNPAETLAEAFSDVYCNGKKASKESRAIVDEMNKYF